jgi:hypothetical protein
MKVLCLWHATPQEIDRIKKAMPRGSLVQEKPLYAALTSGQLRGYAANVRPK